jgi:hypothetical protein
MPWVTPVWKCGHKGAEGSIPMYGNAEERGRTYNEWYTTQLCPKCKQKARDILAKALAHSILKGKS